jgi:outer membrane receptor for ferrienterochelin and colicins
MRRRVSSRARLAPIALRVALACGLAAPAARAQGSSGALRGRVTDAATRAPLADAEVRVVGGNAGVARSAPDGTWQLSLPAAPGAAPMVIRVRHIGYAPRTVTVASRSMRDGGLVETALTPVPLSLDAVVVTASRRPERLKNTPVPTEVISRAEIERTGATDVASVLTQQVGVLPTAGHPSGAGIMLQGLDQQRVLVLLDGRPLTGRISGTFDLSRIPASMVDRVEIVKGPQSTLYGSDAMGGVVNIITRRPEPGVESADLTVLGGTQGRRDVSGELAGQVSDDVRYVANVGHRSVALAPGLADDGGAYARRWDGLATLRWAPRDATTIETSAVLVDEHQRWNAGQLYYFTDNRQLAARVGGVWEPGRQRFAPTLHLSEYRHTPLRGTSPAPPAGRADTEVQRLAGVELLYSATIGTQVIDGGVELERESIRSVDVAGRSRRNYSAEPFVQTTLAIGALRVVPGLRLSWNEQWGTHWTPRLATLWRPVPALALRASVGDGYRAPDFKELYLAWVNDVPGSPYAVDGNPDLRPETSRNVMASMEWAGSRVYGRVQAFDNHFDDFIETRAVGDSAGFTVYTYDNVDRGRTRGVDVDAGLTLGAVRLDGGYSYLDAVWLTTGEPLLGRPAHAGRLALSYAAPFGLRASVTGLATGRAPIARGSDGTTTYQDAYTRLDVRFAQALPFGLEAIVGADDLFDAHPANWPGATERHVYVGLHWRATRERGAP